MTWNEYHTVNYTVWCYAFMLLLQCKEMVMKKRYIAWIQHRKLQLIPKTQPLYMYKLTLFILISINDFAYMRKNNTRTRAYCSGVDGYYAYYWCSLRLNRLKHRIHMPFHLHITPFLLQVTFLIDQERRTHDTFVLLTVHLFQLPDAIGFSYRMVGISE